jgi:hypothetical protein
LRRIDLDFYFFRFLRHGWTSFLQELYGIAFYAPVGLDQHSVDDAFAVWELLAQLQSLV